MQDLGSDAAGGVQVGRIQASKFETAEKPLFFGSSFC